MPFLRQLHVHSFGIWIGSLVSSLQMVSSVDIYYICQMVDGVTREPGSYLRNVEEIFGDMLSSNLVRKYPKWTCFHIFIEELISSVIFEDAENSKKEPGNYWVDYLLRSNGIGQSSVRKSEFARGDGYEYLEALKEQDLISELCDLVSKQVFHVLFSNRGTMSAFGHMVAGYVLHTAPSFVPEAFINSGHLSRTSIPAWVKDAVFHRDKGEANISFTIRKDNDDLSYLGMDHMAKSIEGKGDGGNNASLVKDAVNYKPVRNAVGHTGLLTDNAKTHLSMTFENIKGRIRNLLKS